MQRHRRQPLATLALAAALLGAGALPAPAKAPTARHCPSGGTTVTKSRYVRVYLAESRPFACLFSDGRRLSLGGGDSASLEGPVATAGAFVAAFISDGSEVGGIGLAVYDLRRRRLVRELVFQPEGLVVAAHRGWVAASATYPESPTSTTPEPRIVVADGLEQRGSDGYRIVAAGPGVDPASLRIRGRVIRWKDAGVLRTFRLGTRAG
jgi:hypothetical protein